MIMKLSVWLSNMCAICLQDMLAMSRDSLWASLVAQLVKNLPVMRETWVRSLACEDPLGKGMATHSSILAQRTRWTIVHGLLQLGSGVVTGGVGRKKPWMLLNIFQSINQPPTTKNFWPKRPKVMRLINLAPLSQCHFLCKAYPSLIIW